MQYPSSSPSPDSSQPSSSGHRSFAIEAAKTEVPISYEAFVMGTRYRRAELAAKPTYDYEYTFGKPTSYLHCFEAVRALFVRARLETPHALANREVLAAVENASNG